MTSTNTLLMPGVAENRNDSEFYDLTQLRAISRGNETFLKTMVKLFVEQTPGIVEGILHHHHQGDLQAMASLAHKLKQSIHSMGIHSLKETIFEIVRSGRNGEGLETLPALLDHLEYTSDKVIRGLQKEYNL